MPLKYTVLDVFTDTPFDGNPLGVVSDADNLTTPQMQAIAREFNLSETVFVLKPSNPAHTAAIRIFTPNSELPFAGHPTVGTAVLLAEQRVWRSSGVACDALIVLEAKGGVLRIAARKTPGEAAYAEFDTPKLPEIAGMPAPDDRLAAALGLAPSEIGFENHKPSRFAASLPFTFVPVSGLEPMRRARVVHPYWQDAFGGDSLQAAYLYCRQTVKYKASFHVRVFVPAVGAPEDPATGSAAAAFAGVIMRFDNPPDGTCKSVIEQGVEMGRPSQIRLEFEVASRKIRAVRIGGQAVITMRGELFI